MGQRNIFVFQALYVAHHFSFAMIATENRMLKIITLAYELIWDNWRYFALRYGCIYSRYGKFLTVVS